MDCWNTKINEAVFQRDWLTLTQLAEEIFNVSVPGRELEKSCKSKLGKSWRALESPTMWLKNRLCDIGAFVSLGETNEVKFKTTLHVFFPFLVEDDDMLALLAWDEEQIEEAEARSKIFATQRIPSPIDRVAQRVSGIRRRDNRRAIRPED